MLRFAVFVILLIEFYRWMPTLVRHISSVCAPENNITTIKYLAGSSNLA